MKTMSSFITLVLSISSSLALADTAAPLTAGQKITLPGKAARFDFMETDLKNHRILAAHKGARSVEILDLKSNATIPAIEVGEAQGIAVDTEGHRYFLGNDEDHNVVILNSKNLKKMGEVKVDGPVDAIAFDGKNGRIYAAKDDGDILWVIDAKTKKLVGTISIPGVPEVLQYDSISDRIYLNIKDKNLVVSIDPTTDKVIASWPTAPAISPHGLVIDHKRQRVYSAGGNGKLIAIDIKSGKVISSADIAEKVDQIAFDEGKDLIFSACRGQISVTKVDDAGLKAIGSVDSPKGAHTIAVDPQNHSAWVVFSDENHSYFQSFKLNSAL